MKVDPGITVGGKYRVERLLARGGMGAVWVARHAKLGHAVAIKFLDAHLSETPALVARFEREARAAANLDTPHVVRVHDYGVEDGTPYLVMELLRGEDLNARLRARRRLTLSEAGKILSQMGRALRRAHEAGIVHRDLKPANVFLARVEEDEIIKVLDFGIAKETWSRVDETTNTGEVFGSPHYMSPEQARAQKTVDHRADVWATGVIVYRMVTGKLPFPGEVLGEVLSSVLVDPFPPVAEVAPDLPPSLEGFFARALAKKKDERFSSVSEMVEAFTAIVAVAAEPASERQSMASSTAATLDPPRVSAVAERPNAAEEIDGTKTIPRAARPPTPDIEPPNEPRSAASQAPAETTGPSIATATSSVPPWVPARRNRIAKWGAGLALCGGAATALVLLAGPDASDGPPSSSAQADVSGTAGVASSVSVPVPPLPNTAVPPPATDAPGSRAQPPIASPSGQGEVSASPSPGPSTTKAQSSPQPTTGKASTDRAAATPKTAAPPASSSKATGAPTATSTKKKTDTDWGL